MEYLLKLSPVPLSTGGSTRVYLRVGEDGDVAQPVFGSQDVDALTELVKGRAPDALRCDPEMAAAAAVVGVEVEEAPEIARRARAAIALFMAWGQRELGAVGSDKVVLLMDAATHFWKARPWAAFRDDEALELVVLGEGGRTYEGAVLGEGEAGFGLVLYEGRRSVLRVTHLQAVGEFNAAGQLPAIAVTLDDKPAYAIHALEQAALVPRLPLPLKVGDGTVRAPSTAEVLTLTAALKAVAVLARTKQPSVGEATLGGEQVAVQAMIAGAAPSTLN